MGGFLKKVGTGRGQLYMVTGTIKEPKSQFIFHGGDAAAHGGLGNMAFFGRFGKIEVLCHAADVVKAVDVLKNDLLFLNRLKKSMVNINGF